jgi:hypothetical protein
MDVPSASGIGATRRVCMTAVEAQIRASLQMLPRRYQRMARRFAAAQPGWQGFRMAMTEL